MFISSLAVLQPIRLSLRAALVGILVLLTGCATHYVDGAVKEVLPNQFVKPAQIKPVQLVFEFQTKGAANAKATEHIKPMVMDSVKASGLFSEALDKPVAGAGVLSVVINNVVLTDDVYSKGFMTGLTLGLAGSTVTDGYLCTMTYLMPGQNAPIVKTSKHAIHTALGASGIPPNGVKADTIEAAVRMMVRQITGLALNDLSRDPAFK